jgi:16S rRNA (cytosine967-C5)-methyltransferase
VTTSRDVARATLDRVDRGGAWATLTLDGELARAGLDDRDRRLAAELVYGVLRHRTRIDHALAAHAKLSRTPARVLTVLRVAAYQLLFLRVPSYAAVDDAVAAARVAGGAKLAGFCNAVLRKLATGGEPPRPPGDIGLEHSLPAWIVDELAAARGGSADELAAVASAFGQPAPLVARVNPLRGDRDALIARLATEGIAARPAATPGAALLEGGDPARSASFAAGWWTVQDTGAQQVALTALAAVPDATRVLDACAGVGGKSTHLAELTADRVAIDAADQSATKLGLLAGSAARLGLRSIARHVCDLLDPRAPLAAAYPLIVLDAPCSGLGVLRRHPDAKWRITPADVPRLAALQAQLLDAVARRLAPGGTLIYSVCTFTRAEGPDQIAAFVARSGLTLVSEHRTWPDEPDAPDAFYLARLTRPA